MKKIIKSLVLTALLASLSFASSEVSQSEISKIEDMPILKSSGIKVLKAYKDSDFYLLRVDIQGKMQELVLSSDKKNLITGKVINTTTGEELAIPNDVSILKNKEALTFGTGKDIYYLFTDPECPYCKKFEAYFPQVEKDVQIKVFFFPLSFHKNAVALTKYILDNKTNEDKVKAMLNVSLQSDDFKNKKYSKALDENLDKIIDENMKLGEELGVRGTPALFDINGKAQSWVNVLQRYGVEVK